MTKAEDEERLSRLRAFANSLPDMPGSYQFHDGTGSIIYVGKAKSLKSRVSSYFHKEVDRFKTRVLVSKIREITYTVVKTEEDALLLENSLIKKYQPRYNILLKDGKTYPSICVTKEYLPRIFKTRVINKKAGTYYGPYSHLGSMYAILDIIKKLYHPRTCRQPIIREGIEAGRYKPCLEYHIHNCGAPCIGKQTADDYMACIEQAREILKGNTRQLSKSLYGQMQKAAEELRFEDAEALKNRYMAIEEFRSRSEVVSHTITDVDVFSIINGEKTAYVNYLHVTNGSVNQAFTYEIKKKLDETEEEILPLAVINIRERLKSEASEIVVPFEIALPEASHSTDESGFSTMRTGGKTPEESRIKITVPRQGDKKKLLELSEMNGKQYQFDRLKQAEKLNPEQKQTRLMKELQRALKLEKLPFHIECFDNSNISGTDAVAGCVVFKGLKPSKKDYRKYNIKTVTGPDDYASMHEVVLRRYSRMRNEGSPLPDLIITDGGKGQMEVVRHAVENELHLRIPIAGLAKDARHRTNELLYGFPPVTIGMKTDSELFHVLTRIQDEVHRYAITFHRDKRSHRALHSELDDIKGIGPKTKEVLIRHFKTVRRIRETSLEELANVIGRAKAQTIFAHFIGKNTTPTGN